MTPSPVIRLISESWTCLLAVLKVGWLEKFKLSWLKNFQPAHVKFPASRLP
jgi:hypothetical protein